MKARTFASLTGALSLLLLAACTQQDPVGIGAAASHDGLRDPQQGSVRCAECHRDHYAQWFDSHHAKAHRPLVSQVDAPFLTPGRKFTLGGVNYQLSWTGDRPQLIEQHAGLPAQAYSAEFLLGHTPLRQLIVPVGKGRYQAADLALDPAKNEWFNVFGKEGRKPGEWGHWTGRGMNWNSMCAHCHLTGFDKNYDATNDSYASTWLEHGVGCVQCHGPVNDRHLAKGYRSSQEPLPALHLDRKRMMETCAPCHARNELLTGKLVPGAAYDDQYRLTLPVQRGIFLADGQQWDEDFNYTSFRLSRMGGKGGVTCLDCHDGHTLKTRLPSSNNALCLQCHAAPGRQGAPVIDAAAHSQHKPDSQGNLCVSCHMPTRTYMQRDPRHDHGFLKPDPLLTHELGIPNACTRCHEDKGVAWEIEWTDRWYGSRMNSVQRARARAVSRAQDNRGNRSELLKLWGSEEIPGWRATLLQLAAQSPDDGSGELLKAARTSARAHDPLERSVAAQVLGTSPSEQALLLSLTTDSTRLVRLDAGLALGKDLPASAPVQQEIEAYLRLGLDQPVGRMQSAQRHFLRNEPGKAFAEMDLALSWDPYSPGLHEALSQLQRAAGKPREAALSLGRAADLDRDNSWLSYSGALLWAELGDLPHAEAGLRETLRRDPGMHRAWYNLGLLLAQTQRLREAVEALGKAEGLAPAVADYPFALATVLLRQGDAAGARAAAQRALRSNPSHEGARSILRQGFPAR